MLHGVTINGTNTLTEYGLFLCADLKISEPKLKENRVDIPGGNGSLNMSYSPQGIPVYYDREITFSLAKRMEEAERSTIVSTLRNLYHGREADLILPDDPDHRWHGVIAVGDVSGYNKGIIPIKMTAEPYKYKHNSTVVFADVGENKNLFPYYDSFETATDETLYYAKAAPVTAEAFTTQYAKDGTKVLRVSTTDATNAFLFLGHSSNNYAQILCTPGKYIFSFYGTQIDGSVRINARVYKRAYVASVWTDGYAYAAQAFKTFEGGYERVEIPFQVTKDYPYACIRFEIMTANQRAYIDCIQLEKVDDSTATASEWVAATSNVGTKTVTLTNSEGKPVVPVITATKDATLAWSGYSVSVSAGTNIRVPQLVLEQGSVDVTVTSAGMVSFEYSEGSL